MYFIAELPRPRGIFLLVNPFNHEPYYLGVAGLVRARVLAGTSIGAAARAGVAERRQIGREIRATGQWPRVVVIGQRPSVDDRVRIEAHLVETLLAAGARLTNHQVSPAARAEALAFHVEAIENVKRVSVEFGVNRARPPRGQPRFPPPTAHLFK